MKKQNTYLVLVLWASHMTLLPYPALSCNHSSPSFLCEFFFLFETGSCYVAQAPPELKKFVPQPSPRWDREYPSTQPFLFSFCLFLYLFICLAGVLFCCLIVGS